MCGIFGFLLNRPLTDGDVALGRAGTQSLRHRGPDHTDCWIDRQRGVFLGHNRLFQRQSVLRQAALDVARSEVLEALDFLDMDALARNVPVWVDDPARDAGAFLTYLVTVDRFLRQ